MKKIYTAFVQEEGSEEGYELKSNEVPNSSNGVGDSDWWFDPKSKTFNRFWTYHDESLGLQKVNEQVQAK